MKPKKDKLMVGHEIADGVRIAVRSDDDGERLVTISDHKSGDPLPPSSEYISLSSEDSEGWQDVNVLYKTGPSQVATPAYREGYDRIFGGKQKTGLA